MGNEELDVSPVPQYEFDRRISKLENRDWDIHNTTDAPSFELIKTDAEIKAIEDEQKLTDLEIENMQNEQAITDLEIAIDSMSQNQ